MRRGRKTSSVSKYFTEDDDGRKSCIFCKWTTVAGTSRLIDHILSQCRVAPSTAREALQNERGLASAPRLQPALSFISCSPSASTTGRSSSVFQSPVIQTQSMTANQSVIDNETKITASQTSPASSDLCPIPIKSSKFSDQHSTVIHEKPLGMDQYVSKMTPDQLENAQHLLARAMYTSGSSFRMVENPYWQEFCTALNPAFRMPSTYMIANKFLDKENDLVSRSVQIRIDGIGSPRLTLTCDGWSNVTNDSVVNFCVCDPKPIFLESVLASSERHTAQYISQEVLKQMKKVGIDKIGAIVTDNASNMKAALVSIKNDHPHIATFGCTAHGLNLLLQDYMTLDSVTKFKGDAIRIVKTVNNRPVLRTAVTLSETLKLPVETRWLSWMECLQSLERNRNQLELLALNRENTFIVEKMKPIKATILSEVFWDRVKAIFDIVKVITLWVKIMEEDNLPSLSLVPLMLSELEKELFKNEMVSRSPLSSADESKFRSLFDKRKLFILGENHVHFGASLIDPHVRGRGLSPAEIVQGCQFLSSRYISVDGSNFTSDLSKFRLQEEVFGNNFLWTGIAGANNSSAEVIESRRKMPPKDWWTAYFPEMPLGKLAHQVLNIVPSSASVERVNSQQLRLHTRERNRLAHRRVNKLMNVAVNRRLEMRKRGSLAVYPLPLCTDIVSSDESCTDVESDGEIE